ncbi:three-helix bundle dimerization domain-containing protein [Streptomyces sp. NPDC054841]
MADKAREEDAIRGVVERLKNAFSTTHSSDEVEAAVTEAHASFNGRPVREYVPILVERKARITLNRSSG